MKRYLLLAFCVLLVAGMQAQDTVYVSSGMSNDNRDGSSWENAKRTITAALTQVGDSGVVCVKAGTYNISAELTIPSGVIVKGGYQQNSTGTDTTLRRLPGANLHWGDDTWCTIIVGSFHHRIATVNGILDGCVVSVGFSSSIGGGLLLDGGTARYCVVKECEAVDEDEHSAEGGGVYIRNNGVLINSVVTQCRADNGVGVAGEDGFLINNTITRNSPVHCGYVVDVDGNYYNTVFIGTQCWMRENLKTTRYADSTAIPQSYSGTDNPCYYKNNTLTDEYSQYGLLYNWAAVMRGAASSNVVPSGVQGICPNGWHVPSRSEWAALIAYVSSQRRYRCSDNTNYCGKSLAARTGWSNTYNSCCPGYGSADNNATNFAALPAGYFGSNYECFGTYAIFWCATESSSGSAYYRYIRHDQTGIGESTASHSTGYAVRCLKD